MDTPLATPSPAPPPPTGHGADPATSSRIDMDASARLASDPAGDLTIYQQCIRYGDFSLFEHCPELTRQDLRNADFMTIHPEDLVNVDNPDERWKGYWFLNVPGNPMSFRDKLTLTKKMGYQVCNYNEGFRSQTFEMYPDGVFHYDCLILLVQPHKKYLLAQKERVRPASELVDMSRNAFHQAAADVADAGIGSFEGESAEDGPGHRKGPQGDDIDQSNFRDVVRAGR